MVVVFSEGRDEGQGVGRIAMGSTLNFDPDANFYLGGVPPSVAVCKLLLSYFIQIHNCGMVYFC